MDKEISINALQGCKVAYVNADKVLKEEHKPLEEK
jgi:hypothetical protein